MRPILVITAICVATVSAYGEEAYESTAKVLGRALVWRCEKS
jgi:hypothetical protein